MIHHALHNENGWQCPYSTQHTRVAAWTNNDDTIPGERQGALLARLVRHSWKCTSQLGTWYATT